MAIDQYKKSESAAYLKSFETEIDWYEKRKESVRIKDYYKHQDNLYLKGPMRNEGGRKYANV